MTAGGAMPLLQRVWRRHRHLLAVLAALFAGLGLALSEACAAEDLMAVYEQARAADPLLAAAEARLGVQREAAVQARAALLPQWRLDAGEVRVLDGGARGHELGTRLQQPLLDLGRMRTLDAERTLTTAQETRRRAAEQSLAARVAQAYFGLLSAQAALATARTNESAFAAQVAHTEARFGSGLAAAVDVEQSRTYHALSRGATVQAQRALDQARAAIAQLTGRTPGALRPLAPALRPEPPRPADPEAWVARALEANPELQALALDLEAGERRIAAARAVHAPTLIASLDSQRAGGPAVAAAERGRTTTTVALQLSVPLFAGGATESAVRQAAYRRDLAREDLQAARLAVARETHAQHAALLAAAALLETTAEAVDAARRALEATRTGQALGTRSNTDLLLAIQTQAEARNAHDQARHAWVLARLLLLQAAGSLGPNELAAANALLQGDR